MKRNILTFVLGGCLILLAFFCFFKSFLISCESSSKERSKMEAESMAYYLKYKIKIKGKVVGIKNLGEGRYYLLTINISESNVSHHDLRGYGEDYYLVINSDTARMVEHRIAEINDSIIIDYNDQTHVVWSNEPNERKIKRSLGLHICSPTYRANQIKAFGH